MTVGNTHYCHVSKPTESFYLHRGITRAGIGETVDHIDNNGLNNRRKNLRIVSRGVNRQRSDSVSNSTGYRGVSYIPGTCKFEARIYHDGKCIRLGRFDDIHEAARAYDKKAVELYGDHAFLNIPTQKKSQ